MKPESRKAFVRHWARVVATEIRSEVALPGSGKFDLADIEQRLALRLQDDPKARLHSIPMIAKQIVAQADSARRPCRKDFEETGDLFGFEHKWIPLGQRHRVRFCDASPVDLIVWRAIIRKHRADHNAAADRQEELIDTHLKLMIETKTDHVSEAWAARYGWKPSEDEGDDDEGDEGGEE